MITEEEKTEIIEKAVEKALLKLPDVVGNLITHHAALNELNAKFYKEHPEFSECKDVVASVFESIEAEHPELGYEDIIKKSVPKIKERINTVNSLNTESVTKPNSFIEPSDLGEI